MPTVVAWHRACLTKVAARRSGGRRRADDGTVRSTDRWIDRRNRGACFRAADDAGNDERHDEKNGGDPSRCASAKRDVPHLARRSASRPAASSHRLLVRRQESASERTRHLRRRLRGYVQGKDSRSAGASAWRKGIHGSEAASADSLEASAPLTCGRDTQRSRSISSRSRIIRRG
jgi:hypothetical protein